MRFSFVPQQGDGQSNDEGGAFARLRFKRDRASVFINYQRAANRETLTGAFAYGFGREKRFKDLVADFLRNACARVGNSDLGPIASAAGGYGDRSLFDAAVADHVSDGVAGIDDQVEN